MAWIARNSHLTDEETQNNGRIVASFFMAQGWNKKSVAALCGCMQQESQINPMLWQEYMPEWGPETGYGLVQWTPATRLTEKVDIWHLGNYQDGTVQCMCILGEYNTTDSDYKEWWIRSGWNLTFEQWAHNTAGLDAQTLAYYFVNNYLRPFDPTNPNYGRYAAAWEQYMESGEFPDTPTPTPTPGPGPQPPGPQPDLPIDFTQPWSVLFLKGSNGRRQRVFYGRR